MKIFNQSSRLYTHQNLAIRPGVFTTVPPELEESVTELVKKFPHELLTAESADKLRASATQTVNEQKGTIAQLEAEVARLKRVIANSPSVDAELEKLRAANLEELKNRDQDSRLLNDRLGELTRENLALKGDKETLERQLNELLKAKSETPAAPVKSGRIAKI